MRCGYFLQISSRLRLKVERHFLTFGGGEKANVTAVALVAQIHDAFAYFDLLRDRVWIGEFTNDFTPKLCLFDLAKHCLSSLTFTIRLTNECHQLVLVDMPLNAKLASRVIFWLCCFSPVMK